MLAVDPVTASATIDAPRERVFDVVADLANRPAFFGEGLRDFRLETLSSTGVGASARFRAGRVWIETSIDQVDPPFRLLEQGRGGRLGRTQFFFAYELVEAAGLTEVTLTVWSEPGAPVDRLREALGAERWWRGRCQGALYRLRELIEAGDLDLQRVRIAGGDRQPTGVRSFA